MKACRVCDSTETALFCPVEDRDHPNHIWEVWRCSRCGYGWTAPDIAEDEIGSYYPPLYIGDTKSRMQEYLSGTLQGSRSWKGELDKVSFLERFVSSGRILDVGCSDSSFLLALDPQRWERAGIEYIGGVVEVVRSFFPELEVRQGDVFSESLKEKDFDVITFWHVLEHLFDPDEVLKRAYGLLKPGGRLIVSVPRFDSYQARVFKEHWFAFDVPRHLHHFSQAALRILLQKAGFTVDECIFFSKTSTRHHLKHSLLHWSRKTFGSSLPYYLLKPPLMAVPFLEGLTDGYGTMTIVATK